MSFSDILMDVRSHIFSFIIIIVMAVGCSPFTQPSSRTTQPDIASGPSTDTVEVSPLPTLVAEFHELTLLPDENVDDWVLLGLLENQSNISVVDISIQVSIQNEKGEQITQQIISPLMSYLEPGEMSPFKIRFTNVNRVASYTTEVIAYQTASFRRGRANVDTLSITPTADGGLAILGRVTNPGPSTVTLEKFGLLARDVHDQIKDLATISAGLTILRPGENTPFLVLMEANPGDVEFTPYIDAIVTQKPDASLITILEPPTILLTEQGALMVVGSIINEDSHPRWATLLMVMSQGEDIVAVAPIRMPFPLQSGESRAYAITDFPGLRAQLAPRTSQIDDLSVEIIVDPLGSLPTDLSSNPLNLQITHFEPIGSSLFLRGVISNNGETDVEEAMVQVTIRSTAGELITAGWSVSSERLAIGDSAEFMLRLSIPQGIDPRMSEYDVQATGLINSE
jgi:hypothetical protein